MSLAASASTPRNLAAGATAVLLLLGLVLLLDGPLWLVKLVPSQDGPVHLAQADLIARFGWGGALQEPAATFYQWNPRIEPNSAVYLLLAALIRLSGDALTANTLFLSLYGLLWIAAAFAASRAETERPLLPMLLLLPLAFGVFIHWGFYNFALGVPLFLLFAAFRQKVKDRRDWRSFAWTSLFLLALCLTHITAVVAGCLLLAAEGISRAIDASRRNGAATAFRRLMFDGVWAAAAALPVLLITASFLLAYQNIPGEAPGTDGGTVQVLRRIFAATYLFTFTWWEIIALAPLLGAFAVAAIFALRRIRSGDPTWPIFFALVVALSLLNLKTGSASLSERLAPLSWIAVVMAFASRQPSPALVRILGFAAIIGLCGQTGIRAIAYESWSGILQAELDAGRNNPGASFANIDAIPLRDSAHFAMRVRPTVHANQTAALMAHGAGLSSPLPSTRYFGYFPLQYKAAHDFMRAQPDWDAEPDAAAMAAFRKSSGGAPDVLIVSSFDGSGAELASKLGYGACNSATAQLVACKPAPQMSASR
jgi:hypothetical protein